MQCGIYIMLNCFSEFHFLWRALHEILPTNSELARRHISTDSQPCFLCGDESESVLHILRSCSFARHVWALSHLPSHVIYREAMNVWDWVSSVHCRLSCSDFARFVVTCWCLLYHRNQVRHEDIIDEPMATVHFVNHYLLFQSSVNYKKEVQQPGSAATVHGPWTLPQAGLVKVNFDARVPRNRMAGSIAAVCRDEAGLIRVWQRKNLLGQSNAFTAELMDAKLGVEMAARMGLNNVILEGDALLVIQALNRSDSSAFSSFAPILDSIHALAGQFDTLQFSHAQKRKQPGSYIMPHVGIKFYGFCDFTFRFCRTYLVLFFLSAVLFYFLA